MGLLGYIYCRAVHFILYFLVSAGTCAQVGTKTQLIDNTCRSNPIYLLTLPHSRFYVAVEVIKASAQIKP